MSIEQILILVLVAVLFYGVYWFCGKLTSGNWLKGIGIALATIYVLVVLNSLGVYHLHR